MHRRELRWFYKHAVRGLLPPATILKTKHGFGLPFGVWTRTDPGLRRLAGQALGSLEERGIFRGEFLREALRLHWEDHAVYYGELVWVLMALETWLDANSAAATAEPHPATGLAAASALPSASAGGCHSGSA
jgi:asparagine synthase (glutamine-hydrolysing)